MNTQDNGLFSEGFEIESQQKTSSENESPFGESTDITEKTRDVEALQINPDVVPVNPFDMDEFKKVSGDLLSLSKKIVIISNDSDNTHARDYGKQLTQLNTKIDKARLEANKPDQLKIDKRNDDAKTITVIVKSEVDRLKKIITLYESEVERKRLLELKRIEDEKKAKEEADRKERECVAKIKSAIERIRTEGVASLEKCNELSELISYEAKLNGHIFKPDFYQEFIAEAENEKKQLLILSNQRRPLLEEIERQKQEAKKLEGEKAELAKKELEAKQNELQAQKLADEEKRKNDELVKQNLELEANRELLMLVASFDIKDGETYIKSVVEKYGSATVAMRDRDKLIDDYKQSLIQKAKEEAVTHGKIKNVRTDFEFTILNELEIPREYLCVDEKKIKSAILAHRAELEKNIHSFTIHGCAIFERKSTILK